MTKEKIEDLMEVTKLGELLNPREKKTHPLVTALAVIGGVAVVAGIACAVYQFMSPDYYDDYDDEDFDDDFEDEEAASGEAGTADDAGAGQEEISFT